MRHRSVLLLVSLPICVLLAIICLWFYKIVTMPPVTITNKKLCFNIKNSHIIVEKFLWDTGCEISTFFKETAKKKTCVCFTRINDAHTTKWEPLYYSDSVAFPFGIAVKMIYPVVDTNWTSHFIKKFNLKGAIGMNIINQTNWLIDFTQNIIYADTIFLPDVQPKISVSYKNRRRPTANIYVEDIKIDNIFIDAGDAGSMDLSESDIQSINNKIVSYNTDTVISFGVYLPKMELARYAYNNIKINGYSIDTLYIKQASAKSSIGIGFFRKFDKVYLDTKEQVFKFY